MRFAHDGTTGSGTGLQIPGAPSLEFAVQGVTAVEHAAAPTLGFELRITNRSDAPIRSVILATQLRIAATKRSYDASEKVRLAELFGEPYRWATTLHSVFWTQFTQLVPAFENETTVVLTVPCTYDLDVAAASYFHGVSTGDVPIELLFSGTVFYAGSGGALQIARIPADREASFQLPARAWHDMMDHYFPQSAWLRVRRDLFERLHEYRTSHALGSWEAALEALLERDRAADSSAR